MPAKQRVLYFYSDYYYYLSVNNNNKYLPIYYYKAGLLTDDAHIYSFLYNNFQVTPQSPLRITAAPFAVSASASASASPSASLSCSTVTAATSSTSVSVTATAPTTATAAATLSSPCWWQLWCFQLRVCGRIAEVGAAQEWVREEAVVVVVVRDQTTSRFSKVERRKNTCQTK